MKGYPRERPGRFAGLTGIGPTRLAGSIDDMADPDTIALIDIEASGFGPDSYPLEVAYSPREGDEQSLLINPDTATDWQSWDPVAASVHGIRRDDAVYHGRDVMAVARELNQALGTGVWYSDGFDADLGWLARLYGEVAFEPTFRLASLHGLLREWGADKPAVYDELAATTVSPHRAVADLKRIRELLREVAARGR
jgi:hypothetical protein